MQITGQTAIILMLADPVDHIRGTMLINERFAALGLNATIFPIHVRPASLEQCLATIRRMENVRGLGITIPHKIAAVQYMDHLTENARRLGAVNFARRDPDGSLIGDNMDGIGFLKGLEANQISIENKRCLVVGTGGVGRAIAMALAASGVTELVLSNRDNARAVALAEEISRIQPRCRVRVVSPLDPAALDHIDLLVNATSVGMRPDDPLPLPIERLGPQTTVAEVIVNPPMTRLLSAAVERGCKVVKGSAMLEPQPELVARFFGLLPQD